MLATVLLLPLHVGALGPGDLDTSFSGDGKVITPVCSGCLAGPNAVAVQKDGKTVAAGSSVNASGKADFALVRYNTNGTLDTIFSGDGKVLTDILSDTSLGYSSDYATAVAIQPTFCRP